MNPNLTQDEIKVCHTLLEGRKDIIILDIGAADLTHSFLFKKHIPDCKVFALEPDQTYQPRNVHQSENIGVDYTPGLMSKQDGEVQFYPSVSYKGHAPGHWAGSGSIYKPNQEVIDKTYPTLEFDQKGYSITSYTWDSFIKLKNIDHVDWLHIDVQGAEYEILEEASLSLPDFIFAETCEFDVYHTGVTRDQFDFMMFNKGYVVIATDETNTLYLKAQKIMTPDEL